jgi:orotidine-5'-phosphate decarboxylase
MRDRLIDADRSLIVSVDLDSDGCDQLALNLRDVAGIGAFKIGFTVGLDQGVSYAVNSILANFGENTPIIYDHQKAGNDIPEMGDKFAKTLKHAGVDAAILFPFTGPETQTRWTKSCQDAGLKVIVGGIMTHKKFLVSEGGYIADSAPMKIYELALDQGVRDFVVPGTKPDWVRKVRLFMEFISESDEFVYYAPGFISQGGDLSEAAKEAGKYFHPIVGSAIYDQKSAEDRQAMARQLISGLNIK